MKSYPVLQNGEGLSIDPTKEILKLACCDCGLVHNIAFAIEDGLLGIAMERNIRATGQIRRYRHKK